MKKRLSEIEGETDHNTRKPILSFKEFCDYVYDPLKRCGSLNLGEEEEEELRRTIRRRMRS